MKGGLSGKEKGATGRLRQTAPQGSEAQNLGEPRFFKKSEVPPNPLLEKCTGRVRTAHHLYSRRKHTIGSCAKNSRNTEESGKSKACARDTDGIPANRASFSRLVVTSRSW
jgi:hypothetical protein